ncbi:MAG: type II secretion system F family protein [Thermoplasmata archaeon]
MNRTVAPFRRGRIRAILGLDRLTGSEAVLAVGGVGAAVLAALALGLLSGRALFGLPTAEAFDLFVLALLVLLGPYGVSVALQQRRIEAMDHRLPDLLRDLTDSGRAGRGLAPALVAAGEREYGALTVEVRRIARQILWGVPVETALEAWARRVPTPLVRRTVSVLVRCDRIGGHTIDVLALVTEQAREEERARAARRAAMSTYVAVVYVAFFVFLFTIFILLHLFLPQLTVDSPLAAASGSPIPSIASGVAAPLILALFAAVLIHAVGDGIMVGVLNSGRAVLGLPHATVMLLIGWLVLRLMVGLPGGG